ncbi:DUF1294 domain-containing protein [Zobellella sp. An-6]|uniref:DUF1294 domain-containing protein n=1 Tax=Zobellella sp. An-6 TaxID=3400218 RepID=UPI004041055C
MHIGHATLFVLLFFGLLSVLTWLGLLPGWLPLLYLGLSLVTYGVYAWDKSAARQQQWRVRESTLQLLALAGGWPGALLAQQRLRHKSRKRSFRLRFWLAVATNLGGLLWLLSVSDALATLITGR